MRNEYSALRSNDLLSRFVRWIKYVTTPSIYPERWQDRVFQGHVSIWRVTIFGANAMHWAINIQGRKAWWCFHWRTRTFGVYWPWYFYVSPDATPYSARFKMGARFRGGICHD